MAMKDIVGKLTEMNNQGNLTDDSLRPVVEYRVTDHYSRKMNEVASKLNSMGMNEEAERITDKINSIKAGTKGLLVELGRADNQKAREIERGMVGHGRTGYVPTGNLRRSINYHMVEDDRVQIYPEAQAKNGTEYGGFVEYGTRKHPTPEPFMYQSYKQMKSVVEREVDNLMKGMNAK